MSDKEKVSFKLGSEFGMKAILKAFWGRILATWVIVVVENVLIAMIPFLIGLSIDGLLNGRIDELLAMVAVLVSLGAVSVARRIFDTRAYGTIRVHLGAALDAVGVQSDVSGRNARLDMSRELVDFLEMEVPELITSIIQVIVSLVVLAYFHIYLGASSMLVVAGMLLMYMAFHKRFYRLNATLNSNRERQVTVLTLQERLGVFRHLQALRKTEVSISDTEAILYGGIFLLQIFYIAYNLHLGAGIEGLTPGMIFSIATYSWEFVDAALALPMALQRWTRLSEITARLHPEVPVAQD